LIKIWDAYVAVATTYFSLYRLRTNFQNEGNDLEWNKLFSTIRIYSEGPWWNEIVLFIVSLCCLVI
jgi:hypothetical protein